MAEDMDPSWPGPLDLEQLKATYAPEMKLSYMRGDPGNAVLALIAEDETLRSERADLLAALEQAKADLMLILQNREVGGFGLHALIAPAFERVDAILARTRRERECWGPISSILS